MNVVGFSLFLTFGLADWFVIPDVSELSILIRCVLFITLLPSIIWLIKNSRNVLLLELLLPISTVVGTIFWFELLRRTQSEYTPSYIYAGIIFIVFPNLGMRTFFTASLAYTFFVSSLIFYYVLQLSTTNAGIYLLVMSPFMLISLFVAWHNTYTCRRMYLYAAIKEIDKAELEEANKQLKMQSQTDYLTGLPNRHLFEDRIQQAISRASRDCTKFALMIIDLDGFKPINDNYGHAVGDTLLFETAKRMISCVRESDTVARIGGDEFVVLLPTIESPQDALVVAEKIRDALNHPFVIGTATITISASLGIGIYPEHGEDADSLSKTADTFLYQAKESGRNRVEMNFTG
jgi:diguanylate cyclase (GGDEF)-like protein